MKIKATYALFFCVLISVIFLGNSGGAGAVQGVDRTKSPLSPGDCSTCHGGGNFAATLTAQLLEDGAPITEYEPGEDYTFRLTINTSNPPERYGFQVVALQGAQNANAGTWDSPPSGFRLTNISNRQYVEHNSARTSNVLEIKWKAPVAGSGAVRFYAAGNAVNFNGSTSGDSPTSLGNMPLTIAEKATSSIFAAKLLPATVKIYPNPVRDRLNLSIQIKESGRYALRVFDLDGRERQSEFIELIAGENMESIAVENMPAGNYLVVLSDGERTASAKMLKW